MLKRKIKYTDFNGDPQEEEFCFHLSKAELIEMELSTEGGLEEHLTRIVEAQDGKAIVDTFKDLILKAYGQRSADGKRFIKNQALRDEFASTEAYSELFMEFATDAEAGAAFIGGILPADLDQDVERLTKQQAAKAVIEGNLETIEEDSPTVLSAVPDDIDDDPRRISRSELIEMSQPELTEALRAGAVIDD